jgi:hypothetical protein
MIRTTPFRRTTLQLSQTLVTDALTFIALPFRARLGGRYLYR